MIDDLLALALGLPPGLPKLPEKFTHYGRPGIDPFVKIVDHFHDDGITIHVHRKVWTPKTPDRIVLDLEGAEAATADTC